MEARSSVSMFDFKEPVNLTIHTSAKTKNYIMYVHAFTGLPVMWINTAGGAPIISRDYYEFID